MDQRFKLEDLGFTKSQVKRTFLTWYDRPADDQWANRVTALLAERRTVYTLNEINDLLDVMNTSHHQCVLENADDYHHLTVRQHEHLEDRLNRAYDYVQQAQLAAAPSRLTD